MDHYKTYQNLYYYAKRKGLNNEQAEDFRAWAIINVIERQAKGLSQPQYKYLFIDYLRAIKGNSKSASYCAKHAIIATEPYDDGQSYATDKTSKEHVTNSNCINLRLPQSYRVILYLSYHYRMKQKEIGEIFGVTEARICQILKLLNGYALFGNINIPDKMDIKLKWITI